ncbi:ferritin heavy chain B-like [Anolis sagrei]|uniref:ferritin heavy chain B-like n=1 Tax=Anolis sagrei TaxID=38937 RepID=UPI00295ACB85|nr:ferritin heavy chain B-like [Anolis sagrei ordinatus]
MGSQVNQNYHVDCEAAVNCVANLELYASYAYLSMSYYFKRDDVALKHVADFFSKESLKKSADAEAFLNYQNKRGGCIILQDIQKPEKDEWENSLVAFESALRLESILNQALLDLHHLALQKGDPHMCDFLKSFLEDQVAAVKELGSYISNLRRLEVPHNGLGEHLFDQHSFTESA